MLSNNLPVLNQNQTNQKPILNLNLTLTLNSSSNSNIKSLESCDLNLKNKSSNKSLSKDFINSQDPSLKQPSNSIQTNHINQNRHSNPSSIISPKDLIALESLPSNSTKVIPNHSSFSSNQSISPFSSANHHHRTLSANSLFNQSHLTFNLKNSSTSFYHHPFTSPAKSSNSRHSWNSNQATLHHYPPPINLSPIPSATLTEQDIKGIEQFGVKFVNRDISNLSSNSQPITSFTSNLSNPIRHPTRNPQILNSKRRKSIKLNLPSFNISNPSDHLQIAQTSTIQTNDHQNKIKAIGINSIELIDLIAKSGKGKGKENDPPLLVIDLRTLDAYLGSTGRLKGSINVNFPSLLIKRFLKGSFGNFQLNSFITTEAGKQYYSDLEKSYQAKTNNSSSILDQLDICVIDDNLNDQEFQIEKSSATSNYHHHHSNLIGSAGRILLDVLIKLFNEKQRSGGLYFLNQPFLELIKISSAQKWLLFGEIDRTDESNTEIINSKNNEVQSGTSSNYNSINHLSSGHYGLLSLRPSELTPSLPSIDQDSRHCFANDTNQSANQSITLNNSITFSHPKSSKLSRINKSSLDSLQPTPICTTPLPQKRSLKQIKTDPQTLTGSSFQHSRLLSPSSHPAVHLSPTSINSVLNSKFSQAGSGSETSKTINNSIEHPQTFHQTLSPSQTPHPEASFKVSIIIPSFLFLGPEPSKDSDFLELSKLGVKIILNLALECTDEEDLIKDRHGFIEKYNQIPLRDFVEEVGVQDRIDEANAILDAASLHSAPTYVHCKAGKSRSVMIILAYLIHRYRWSLKKSYAHVSERRKGICPNIGFLAELMHFEERELGNKSRSMTGPTTAMRSVSHHCHSASLSSPIINHQNSINEDINTINKSDHNGSSSGGITNGFHSYSLSQNIHNQDRLENHKSSSPTWHSIKHNGIRVRSVALTKHDLPRLIRPREN